jgi:TatA/E family protein of Tat protein translocase
LSPIKILVIIAVVMILLGPDKLPEVANKLGQAWRSLRRFQQKVEQDIRTAVPDLPSAGELARFARSPVNLLNELADRANDSSLLSPTAVAAPETLGSSEEANAAIEELTKRREAAAAAQAVSVTSTTSENGATSTPTSPSPLSEPVRPTKRRVVATNDTQDPNLN